MTFVSIFIALILVLINISDSTSCTTANIGSFEEFKGMHKSHRNVHKWQIKFIKLSDSLYYDVEIINGDKIALINLSSSHSIPPAMIFIHGWLDSRLNWMTIIRYILNMVDPNQIIILPSLRGHGDSQIFPIKTSIFNYNQFVDDIISLLLPSLGFNTNQQKFNLIGHSMGGGIAMQTVINHPNIISKLILMDTSPSFNISSLFSFDEIKNEPTFQQKMEIANNFNFPQVENGWISKELCDIMNRENIKANSIAVRMSFNAFNNVNLTNDLIETINQFDIKSMVLFGEYDLIPIQHQMDYAQKINAKIIKFEDCGHDPHYRYPQRVATSIVNFLYDTQIKTEL